MADEENTQAPSPTADVPVVDNPAPENPVPETPESILVSEPLPTPSETPPEPAPDQTAQSEPVPEALSIEPEQPISPTPAPIPSPPPQVSETKSTEPVSPPPEVSPSKSFVRNLLEKARATIQTRKRLKLDKIMTRISAKGRITNDEVEKLLHVSDATATRYLSILEKEGKIKQNGKTGHMVSYSRI